MDSTSEIRRLALIKYIFSAGLEQSKKSEPMSAMAILSFHDAVELYLQLASERHNVGSPKTRFMEYFDLIDSKLPKGDRLHQKESIRRLNNARVAFKHHGILPPHSEIQSFRMSCGSFLEENTPMLFGVELSAVSLIDFVFPGESRDCLKSALENKDKGEPSLALADVAKAYFLMLEAFEGRGQDTFEGSPYRFGERIGSLQGDALELYLSGESEHELVGVEQFQSVIESLLRTTEDLQGAVRVLALGLDYHRYVHFRRLAPMRPARTLDGKLHIFGPWRRESEPVSPEDVTFCIDYVVESAIQLQQHEKGRQR